MVIGGGEGDPSKRDGKRVRKKVLGRGLANMEEGSGGGGESKPACRWSWGKLVRTALMPSAKFNEKVSPFEERKERYAQLRMGKKGLSQKRKKNFDLALTVVVGKKGFWARDNLCKEEGE